jgi:hypothetical protein
MPITVLIIEKRVVVKKEAAAVLAMYREALEQARLQSVPDAHGQPGPSALGTSVARGSLWKHYVLKLATVVTGDPCGDQSVVIPQVKVNLETPAEQLLRDYLHFLNTTLCEQGLNADHTQAEEISSPSVLTRLLLYRMVVIALDDSFDPQQDGDSLLNALNYFIESLKKKTSIISRQLIPLLSAPAMRPFFTALFSYQHEVHLAAIRQVINTLKSIYGNRAAISDLAMALREGGHQLKTQLIAFIAGPVAPKTGLNPGNFTPEWLDTTLHSCEEGLLGRLEREGTSQGSQREVWLQRLSQTAPSLGSETDFVKQLRLMEAGAASVPSVSRTRSGTGPEVDAVALAAADARGLVFRPLYDSRVSQREKRMLLSLSLPGYSRDRQLKIRHLYYLINVNDYLCEIIDALDVLTTCTGWVPILMGLLNFQALGHLLRDYEAEHRVLALNPPGLEAELSGVVKIAVTTRAKRLDLSEQVRALLRLQGEAVQIQVMGVITGAFHTLLHLQAPLGDRYHFIDRGRLEALMGSRGSRGLSVAGLDSPVRALTSPPSLSTMSGGGGGGGGGGEGGCSAVSVASVRWSDGEGDHAAAGAAAAAAASLDSSPARRERDEAAPLRTGRPSVPATLFSSMRRSLSRSVSRLSESVRVDSASGNDGGGGCAAGAAAAAASLDLSPARREGGEVASRAGRSSVSAVLVSGVCELSTRLLRRSDSRDSGIQSRDLITREEKLATEEADLRKERADLVAREADMRTQRDLIIARGIARGKLEQQITDLQSAIEARSRELKRLDTDEDPLVEHEDAIYKKGSKSETQKHFQYRGRPYCRLTYVAKTGAFFDLSHLGKGHPAKQAGEDKWGGLPERIETNVTWSGHYRADPGVTADAHICVYVSKKIHHRPRILELTGLNDLARQKITELQREISTLQAGDGAAVSPVAAAEGERRLEPT